MKTTLVALKLFIVLALLTGIIYPLIITGIGAACFPWQTKGSVLENGGKPVGSKLLAQEFTEARYFHGRPTDCDYATLPSGASNLGPVSRRLDSVVHARTAAWQSVYGANDEVPGEMVTASGSGLDPDISIRSAQIQLTRVSKARNWNPGQLKKAEAILDALKSRFPGAQYKAGTVNVLLLNLSLQHIKFDL
jgi:potassium-transporting ATPase KdpC subunit